MAYTLTTWCTHPHKSRSIIFKTVNSDFLVSGASWTYLVLLYVYVQVSRVIVVGVSFPFLRYFGYGLDWKEAIILIWSGLRGAVALSLSLSVKARSCEFFFSLNDLNLRLFFPFIFFPGFPIV